MCRLLLLAFVLSGASSLYGQAEWPTPKWGKLEALGCGTSDKAVTSSVGNYEVRLVPVEGVGADGKASESRCRAYLVDRAGNRTMLIEDIAVSIYQGTGDDVFGDGNPSLILEGSSCPKNRETHCNFTYEMISLAELPLILPPITNETPFFFFKDPASGRFSIMTSDDAFANFDGLCRDCTPFPRVVLQVESGALRDVGPNFAEQYDSEIALARAKIAKGEIGRFLESDFKDARRVVLEIAFSYLYSGREAQAWQTLDEMWPAGDRKRIKNLIVNTRARGILSRLGNMKPASISPSYTPSN